MKGSTQMATIARRQPHRYPAHFFRGLLIDSAAGLCHLINPCNALQVLRSYLALTEALPLIRLGDLDSILNQLPKRHVVDFEKNVARDIGQSAEVVRRISVAVMDAVTGHENIRFRDFLSSYLGWSIQPDYRPDTLVYLRRIQEGFTSDCRVERKAAEAATLRVVTEIEPAVLRAVATASSHSLDNLSGSGYLCSTLWSEPISSLRSCLEEEYYNIGLQWFQEIALSAD